MGRRRGGRGRQASHTQPSDHDPKVREEAVAFAAVLGVTYEFSSSRNLVYGWIPDPNRSGYRLNSPMVQQRYQVARWFVKHLSLKEELPCECSSMTTSSTT